MKNIVIAISIYASVGMFTLLSCEGAKPTKIILSTEILPDGQTIYTVSGSKPYTFIDSTGKYQIGEVIK